MYRAGRSRPGPSHREVAPMPITEAQRQASRVNGSRGRGPTSDAGKERSRTNSYKHGLTATVVVPGEDAEELHRRSAALHRELNPATQLGRLLVGRISRLTLRLERGA